MWMGGPTEFAKVVAIAQAQGVAVVPHGCGVYGYYMAMAFGHITLAEFMMMSDKADEIWPNFGSMFTNEPLPKDGYITLPDTPGFGLELNKEALNLIRPFDRSGGSATTSATAAAAATATTASAGTSSEPAAKKARTSTPSADAIARLMALAAKHGAGDKDIAQAAAFQ